MGAKVHKGQVLLTISSPEFAQAKASFLQARAKFNLSRKEYDRAKALFQEKAIDQKEYLRREAEHENLAAEYGAIESILHSYGLDHEQIDNLIKNYISLEKEGKLCELTDPSLCILSPIQGTIIFRDVIVGEHVEPQKILFTVSDLSLLWAVLDAYEKDLPLIDKKGGVTVISPLYPEKEFKGEIAYISDIIDEKLRTIKIRAEVKNVEKLLKPNMYIQGIIENREEEKNRPVLMTTFTTIFGILPLMLAKGPGAEIQRPLATVVFGGLLTSTLVTLLALPLFYQTLKK